MIPNDRVSLRWNPAGGRLAAVGGVREIHVLVGFVFVQKTRNGILLVGAQAKVNDDGPITGCLHWKTQLIFL